MNLLSERLTGSLTPRTIQNASSAFPNINITSIDSKFYFTVTNPAISASRPLQTPWPMVTTLFAISFCFATYALHKVPSKESLLFPDPQLPYPSTWRRFKDKAIYAFHLLRSLFAITLLLHGLATKRYLGPGAGLLLNQANLLLSACNIDPKRAEPWTYHLGINVASVGMFLYFTNWILAGANHQDSSVRATVTIGGDSNPARVLIPGQKLAPVSFGDTLLGISWYWSMPFLLFLPFMVMQSWVALLQSAIRGTPLPRMGSFTMLSYFCGWTFVVVCVSGGLAVGAAVLNEREYVLRYVDCRNATNLTGAFYYGTPYGCLDGNVTFPGNKTGFWKLWTGEKLGVAESLITW